jgi:hypothetical protein
MDQATNRRTQRRARPDKALVRWRNLGALALFLYGTTFLWLTSAFAGTGTPASGTAWTVTQLLVITTIGGFSVAAWGIYKATSWWERLASARPSSASPPSSPTGWPPAPCSAAELSPRVWPATWSATPRYCSCCSCRRRGTGSRTRSEADENHESPRGHGGRAGGGLRRLRSGALSPLAPAMGATDGELTLALPGDELVERPHFNFTRAITIQARPEGSGSGWSRSAMAGPAGTATTRWTTWAGPAPNSSSPSCSSSRWATGSRWVASPGRPRPCA